MNPESVRLLAVSPTVKDIPTREWWQLCLFTVVLVSSAKHFGQKPKSALQIQISQVSIFLFQLGTLRLRARTLSCLHDVVGQIFSRQKRRVISRFKPSSAHVVDFHQASISTTEALHLLLLYNSTISKLGCGFYC